MPSQEPHPNKKDHIESLNDSLYSRNYASDETLGAPKFKPHEVEVKDTWEGEKGKLKDYMPTFKEEMPILNKLFIAALAFFAICILVASFVFLGEKNIVSSENVDISIIGPVSVNGGEPFSFQISLENQNNTVLEDTYLLIQYPEGTRRSDDVTTELKRYREELGSIEAGKTITKKADAVFFGEEGVTRTIVVTVEYRVRGSNAIFTKNKPYEVVIMSAPVTVTIDSLKEVNSGQEVEFVISIASNASTLIKDLMLQSEYPFGFNFVSATPKPVSAGSSTWLLGDLKEGARKIVRIRGKMEGEDEEERTFRFSVGTEHPKELATLGTTFLTSPHSILIKKPFIGIGLSLDNDTAKEHIVSSGGVVQGELVWKNNLPTRVTDAKIEVKLSGGTYLRGSVIAQEGFYRSVDNTLVWDQKTLPELAQLNPGDTGRVTFSFVLVGAKEGVSSLRNPEMSLEISVGGKRIGDTNVPEQIAATLVRKIRLASDLDLAARIAYATGAFTNTGPVPPRADKETTYTVVWTVTNTTNNLNNVKVRGILPPYVKWLDKVSPSTDKVSHDATTGEVVWEAGTVEAGTGYGKPVREMSFQVSMTPSVSQVGSSPLLVRDVGATGEDRFTNVEVRSKNIEGLTTSLTGDPIGEGKGNVTR